MKTPLGFRAAPSRSLRVLQGAIAGLGRPWRWRGRLVIRHSRCGASRPPERGVDPVSFGPPRLRARWLPDGTDSAASARGVSSWERLASALALAGWASFSGGRASGALAFSQAFLPGAGRLASLGVRRCLVARAAQHAAGADRPSPRPTGALSPYTWWVGLRGCSPVTRAAAQQQAVGLHASA